MQININTGNSIEGSKDLDAQITERLQESLRRFQADVTRIEVHLRDENSHKGGSDDIKCMIEARVRGMDPVAVTHNAGKIEHAVSGARDKLKGALDSALGKRKSR